MGNNIKKILKQSNFEIANLINLTDQRGKKIKLGLRLQKGFLAKQEKGLDICQ